MADFRGEETLKAVQNWGEEQTPLPLIRAYGEVKKSALLAVQECTSSFPSGCFAILTEVLDEIIEGKHNSLFVLPLKQGGAGTSLNMNMNEVISHLCNERQSEYDIHKLEDINRFQSTNDTFNTAVTIVFLRDLETMESEVIALQETLVALETEYSSLIITGRTEMQSALPMTLGQVFASWAGAIERDRWRLNKVKERVRASVLGGTAMGTCFSAPSKYLFAAERHLRAVTGLSLPRSQNLTSDISFCDKFTEAASVLDALSNNLFKIASDLLLYTSSLCGEIIHPSLQYGSTIMPFKTNPVLPEYIKGLMINASLESRKIGEYSRNGQFQLNAWLPFLLEAEISLADSLKKGLKALDRFFREMKVDRERIQENLISSGALINALRPYCQYDDLKKAAEKIEEKKISSLEEVISLLTIHTSLSEEFLKNYLAPGVCTSFFKELI